RAIRRAGSRCTRQGRAGRSIAPPGGRTARAGGARRSRVCAAAPERWCGSRRRARRHHARTPGLPLGRPPLNRKGSGREGTTMANATQVLAAFREMIANKNLSRDDLHDLIKDGIMAALARRYGPNVEAEIRIDEDEGDIKIMVLKEVVAEVEDPSREVSLEEARWDDPDFEIGDVLEIPVEFADFGRNAVMAAKQRIIQRVREGERNKIRDEYANRVGELLSGEVQQVERGKIVVMLNKSREADAIIPWKEQNPRER